MKYIFNESVLINLSWTYKCLLRASLHSWSWTSLFWYSLQNYRHLFKLRFLSSLGIDLERKYKAQGGGIEIKYDVTFNDDKKLERAIADHSICGRTDNLHDFKTVSLHLLLLLWFIMWVTVVNQQFTVTMETRTLLSV